MAGVLCAQWFHAYMNHSGKWSLFQGVRPHTGEERGHCTLCWTVGPVWTKMKRDREREGGGGGGGDYADTNKCSVFLQVLFKRTHGSAHVQCAIHTIALVSTY